MSETFTRQWICLSIPGDVLDATTSNCGAENGAVTGHFLPAHEPGFDGRPHVLFHHHHFICNEKIVVVKAMVR